MARVFSILSTLDSKLKLELGKISAMRCTACANCLSLSLNPRRDSFSTQQMDGLEEQIRLSIGGAQAVLSWATRLSQLTTLLTMLIWVFGFLGGVRVTPEVLEGNANDTGGVFNWHPICMTLAFMGAMAEALLAYKAPLLALKDRPRRKAYHAVLHSAALLLASMGLVAAFSSHRLKLPKPIPDVYSVSGGGARTESASRAFLHLSVQ